MKQLQVEAEGTTEAAPDVVWSLVADANSYPQWGPWRAGGYRPAAAGPSAPGAIQWFRYGRLAKTTEQVLEVEPPRRLVYTVLRGMPVRNYWAEVTFTPAAGGRTAVRWAATWDRTVFGRLMRRRLQLVYREVVDGLVAEADRRQAPTPEGPETGDLSRGR